jgi:hypothetical protein
MEGSGAGSEQIITDPDPRNRKHTDPTDPEHTLLARKRFFAVMYRNVHFLYLFVLNVYKVGLPAEA